MADSLFRINRGITLNPQSTVPTGPSNGDLYYDSTLNTYAFYDNGFWINLASRVDVASATDLTSTQLTALVVQNSLVRITGSTATNVHGLVASTAAKQVLLYNQTSSTVIIKYASATEGTAANRILTPTLGDVTLTSGQTMVLVYDDSQARWITSSSPGTGGSGSGVGDDLDALLFKASFQDNFDEGPTSSLTSVNSAAAQTDPTAYNASKAMYTLNYDAGKTIAAGTTTTNINISATAAFTVKTGDVVIVGGLVGRITAVATQASFTCTTLTSTPTLGAQVTISQAVHTQDIYNLDVDGNSIADAFPSAPFSDILVDYEDTTTAGDNVFDINTAPVVGWVATNGGGLFTTVQTRPTLETSTVNSTSLGQSGTTLVLRFFANKTSGSGSVNLLRYKVFVQKDTATSAGGTLNSAYAFTNSVGTPVNCSVGVAGGKTTITLTGFTYAVGVASGTPYGSLDVYLNGQLIPRFIDSTLTPDASYLETSATVLTLDRDYSSQNISVEILQRVGIVDVSTANTTNISAIQEIQQNGFQGFINQSNLMTATTSTGAPVAGTFYSTIVGRSSMIDLSQDLRPRMAIERMIFQQPVVLVGELGASNEQISGVLNDTFNQVRLIGNWTSVIGTTGMRVRGNNTTDLMEITFYGTGLNLLVDYANYLFTSATYSVDGGSNLTVTGTNGSAVLQGRNYSANQVLQIASGLTLGIHTIKILAQTSDVYGCEILNESSSLKIQPGISYLSGKKLLSSAQTVTPYNTTFETGSLGSRGGRVVVYQKADGTVAKAVQSAGSQLNLTSADHTLEEVVKTFLPREFGAGRSDDFSTLTTASSRAYTLDDGSTILTCVNGAMPGGFTGGSDALNVAAGTANNVTLNFIGTGLDVLLCPDGATRTFDVFVDGTNVGQISTLTTNTPIWRKVVSGLAYGSHVVRFQNNSAGISGPGIIKWASYQPKKPSVPSGAVELADYNVMATYVANTTAGIDNIATGVIRKHASREFVYVNGTGGATDWVISGLSTSSIIGGFEPASDRTNAFFEYTFFGTGLEIRFVSSSNRSSNISVTINGLAATTANFPSLVSSAYGTGVTFSAGVLDQADASTTNGSGVSLNSLPLATYKIRFNNNTASSNIVIDTLDIIAPIHSNKSNIYADLQNTLPVGSNGISDNRKLTPVKDILPGQKAWAQAIGIQNDPSTTSNVPVPIPDMSVTIKTVGGPLEVNYSVECSNTNTGNNSNLYLYVDGFQINTNKDFASSAAGIRVVVSECLIVPVSPGTHKVDVYWTAAAGTLAATGTRRNLNAREI